MYTVVHTGAFGTPAGDLLQIVAGATETVILHSLAITGQTETDDSNTVIISRFATIGSGGAALDANPLSLKTGADSATILGFNTTDATSTETILYREGFSVLSGYQKIWTPEMRPEIDPTGNIVIRLGIAWTADPTLHVTCEFEEIG
jgi:hypothetical protein